jgi:hypothetical protein
MLVMSKEPVFPRRRVLLVVLIGLVALAVPGVAPSGATAQSSCPATAPDSAVTASQLHDLEAQYVGYGLYRPAGTAAHEQSMAWLQQQLESTPGITVRSYRRDVISWQPTTRYPDGSANLAAAGDVSVRSPGGRWRRIPMAGAVPLSLPTGRDGIGGTLADIGAGPITPENARGRVVIINAPDGSLPNAAFGAVSWYFTPDLVPWLTGTYRRPYLGTDGPLAQRLYDAGKAGASGVIVAWDVPRAQIAGYFDPHQGVNFTVPAVFAGVDEAQELRRLAANGDEARVAVHAERGTKKSPTLIATLHGAQKWRTVLQSHSDGMSWVQENGPIAILALVKWFATLPQNCRPTIEADLTVGHLVQSPGENTADVEAARLDKEFDQGTVGAVMTLEHVGSREIESSPRTGGKPGNELHYTGLAEPTGISVSDSPVLLNAITSAVQRRGLARTLVLKGTALPTATVPEYCFPGGDNTAFWWKILPAVQAITGPYSLFAPSFGEKAIDFDRMATETLVFADAVLDVAPRDPSVVAGPVLATYRVERANGATTCDSTAANDARKSFNPHDQAPGPGANPLRVPSTVTRRLRVAKRSTVLCVVTGGGAPRTCTARLLLRRRIIARGRAFIGADGRARIRLRVTRHGRKSFQSLSRRTRVGRIVLTARDHYGVTESRVVRVRFVRRSLSRSADAGGSSRG